MYAIAELAIEAIGIEKERKSWKSSLLAIVRRGGRGQQVPCAGTKLLCEEAAGLFELRAEEVGGELVGFVKDH